MVNLPLFVRLRKAFRNIITVCKSTKNISNTDDKVNFPTFTHSNGSYTLLLIFYNPKLII